jgi:DNA polymerase-3 subunit alpha
MTLDLSALSACLAPLRQPDGCPVTVRYVNGKAAAKLDLGADWRVRVRDSELAPLRRLLGEQRVRVVYRRPSAPMAGE